MFSSIDEMVLSGSRLPGVEEMEEEAEEEAEEEEGMG